uniref:Uncharacterized protein n=1 Tax=Tanacetum cinerariifolium TaxID=118510 RepID=A0A6L2M4C6_TANCI|nr:hypothetical protein [Tanacetum cinerariifolium]
METPIFIEKGRWSGKGVKEKEGVVNAPATVIGGMDCALVLNLGDNVGKESEGLNSSPTGIALSPSVLFATLVKDIVVFKESVCVVNERLNNTVYGFLGKCVVYPVSKDEMESMLENGLWLIRNVPLILKEWTPYANIINEDVCNILVWVKTAICTDSCGRASYARAMVELRTDVELKDTIVLLLNLLNLKKRSQAIRGITVVSKPKSNFIYRPVQSTKKTDKAPAKPKVTKGTNATTSASNSFDALNTLRGFLSQKGNEGGRGVKEKQSLMVDKEKSGVKPSAYKDDVAPYVTVASGENSSSQEENSVKAGHDNLYDMNAEETPSNFTMDLSKGNSYANLFTGETTRKALNSRTLFTSKGNRVDVFSSMDGLNAMLENGLWFIRNNPLNLKKWNPNVNLVKEDVANVLVWVKLHGVFVTAFSEDGLSDDVELKDNIMAAMPKLVMEGLYTCNVYVEYEWKPPRCACCKVFGDVHAECPKNTDSNVVKSMKKPGQAPRGVPVGPKVGFKPVKQVFRQLSKKNNVNTSGNKKKEADAEPTINVSNSNLFDVLNSVENDVDLGTNGKPLKKVAYPDDHDSEDEVESVNNDMARFMALERLGFGTSSLLKQ